MFPNIKRHRENAVRCLLIVLNLAVASAIFFFSSQPAELSDPLSKGLIYRVLKLFFVDESELVNISAALNGTVRKLAHFSIYGVFSVLMYLLLSRYSIKNKTAVISAIIICLIYAAADEIHQYFVPGRSCEIRDVFIDFCGILSGIILICLIKRIKSKFNKV